MHTHLCSSEAASALGETIEDTPPRPPRPQLTGDRGPSCPAPTLGPARPAPPWSMCLSPLALLPLGRQAGSPSTRAHRHPGYQLSPARNRRRPAGLAALTPLLQQSLCQSDPSLTASNPPTSSFGSDSETQGPPRPCRSWVLPAPLAPQNPSGLRSKVTFLGRPALTPPGPLQLCSGTSPCLCPSQP